MAKATTIKEALRRWEEKHGKNAAEAAEVLLCFQWPPIEKMDNSLAILTNCTRLSLSTNMIEKISGVGKRVDMGLGRDCERALTPNIHGLAKWRSFLHILRLPS